MWCSRTTPKKCAEGDGHVWFTRQPEVVDSTAMAAVPPCNAVAQLGYLWFLYLRHCLYLPWSKARPQPYKQPNPTENTCINIEMLRKYFVPTVVMFPVSLVVHAARNMVLYHNKFYWYLHVCLYKLI